MTFFSLILFIYLLIGSALVFLFVIAARKNSLLFMYPLIPGVFLLTINLLRSASQFMSLTTLQKQQVQAMLQIINIANLIWLFGMFIWIAWAYRVLKSRSRQTKSVIFITSFCGLVIGLQLLASWLFIQ